MNKYLKMTLVSVLIVLATIVFFYGSLFFIFIYYDQAHYYSENTNLGSPDYYAHAVSSARGAGYEVELYGTNSAIPGLRPGGVEGLDPRLGSDYLVNSLDLYYSDSSWLSVFFPNRGESRLSFWNEDPSAKYRLEDLPERGWMVEKFEVMFDLNEAEMERYLPAENWEANDIFFAQVTVAETLDFAATRRHLLEESTNSTFDAEIAGGGGGCSETFYNESQKVGHIYYIVPSAEISHREGWHMYRIKIDKLGGVNLKVSLGPGSTGKTIPEENYRAVFKTMFVNLGLPPEKVGELDFEYNGGTR